MLAARLPSATDIAAALHDYSRPFVVVHGYWNASRVSAARAELTRSLAECHETNEDGSDLRRLGTPTPLAAGFAHDAFLQRTARAYLRKSFNTKVQAGLARAGESSGGGWHQDTRGPGIKAMIYLDDVDESNGPFAMLLGYDQHRLKHSPDPRGRVTRYNQSSIEIEISHGARVHPVYARAGSLIVFEISRVHRGMPVARGERAALTNYYKVKRPSTVCAARPADQPPARSMFNGSEGGVDDASPLRAQLEAMRSEIDTLRRALLSTRLPITSGALLANGSAHPPLKATRDAMLAPAHMHYTPDGGRMAAVPPSALSGLAAFPPSASSQASERAAAAAALAQAAPVPPTAEDRGFYVRSAGYGSANGHYSLLPPFAAMAKPQERMYRNAAGCTLSLCHEGSAACKDARYAGWGLSCDGHHRYITKGCLLYRPSSCTWWVRKLKGKTPSPTVDVWSSTIEAQERAEAREANTSWAATMAQTPLYVFQVQPSIPVRNCAVVGSSGALLADRYGAEIDAHDVVIRFNDAPTRGYEPIVGGKTTIRVMNTKAALAVLRRCALPHRCVARDPSCCPRDGTVLLNSGRQGIAECYQRVCGASANIYPLLWAHPVPHNFRTLNSRRTMSGVYGAAIASLMCHTQRIDLYGFTAGGVTNDGLPYHYYDACNAEGDDPLNKSNVVRLPSFANRTTNATNGGFGMFPMVRLNLPRYEHAIFPRPLSPATQAHDEPTTDGSMPHPRCSASVAPKQLDSFLLGLNMSTDALGLDRKGSHWAALKNGYQWLAHQMSIRFTAPETNPSCKAKDKYYYCPPPGWHSLKAIDCRHDASLVRGEVNLAAAAAAFGFTYIKNPTARFVCAMACEARPGCQAVVVPQRVFWRSYACIFVDAAAANKSSKACVKSEYFYTLRRDDTGMSRCKPYCRHDTVSCLRPDCSACGWCNSTLLK